MLLFLGGLASPAAYYLLHLAAAGGQTTGLDYDINSASIFGVLLTLPIAAYLATKIFHVQRSWIELLDRLIVPLLIVQICGKFGCWVAGCCYGTACDIHLAGLFDIQQHPAQLYELLCLIAILFFLFKLSDPFSRDRKTTLSPGSLTLLYYITYSSERFLVDFVRPDYQIAGSPFSASQVLCCIIVLITTAVLLAKAYAGCFTKNATTSLPTHAGSKCR